MKKLLSTIMALVMLLSLMPMAVAEEGVTAENAVAQIGDQYYKTLEDAVLKVANGDTITLLKDVALDNGLKIGSVDSEQKVLTLDLNGHSISAARSVIGVQNSKLTVTGPGKIYETSPYLGAIYIKGSNNAENKDYTVVNIGAGVELEAWSPIFVTPFESSGAPYAYGVVVNVDGAKLTGKTDSSGDKGSAIYVNGQIKDQNNAPKLVLNNVTQTAAGTGMYLAGYANTTITGGSITGSNTGIEIRAGELTVNGATVVGNGVPTGVTPNGNGSTTDGAGIAVAQHTTKLPIKVTINSGDISGYSALYQSNPEKNDDASVKKVSVAVNGGTFKAINGGTCGVYSENNCVTISGGAFTDLASAVKYATDGATITLAGDAKGDIVIPAGKTITLDLGGHKLTNVSGDTITNKGTLTITGTGTVDNVTNGKAALVNYGTATLNGGNFTRSKENAENNKDNGGGNSYYTILNDKGATMTINEGVTVSNVGHFSSMIRNGGDDKTAAVSTMTINGGTFSGGINTVKNDENGVLTINGGDFSNTSQFVIMNWNKATIFGGTFEANASAEAVLFTAKYLENRAVGELKIEGGTYVCAANQKLIVDRYNNDDQYLGTAVISAGAFNVAPDAKYLAEGMIVVPGVKDAPYNVQPAKREDENSKSEVKVDGDNVTVTITDKTTGTTTETVTDTKTGAETVTKTETKVEGNVTTKTETVTEKNAAGETTKVTESKIVENTENGKTETKTTVDGKTVKTDVTVNQAPATASDVTLNAKALEGKAAGTETSSVTVDKASLSKLKNDTVKDVIIETDQATLKLDKTAVKTMESKVEDNDKMKLNVTVTEEKNATTTEIEKVKVEVNAKNEAGENVFPENTANTNGLINITIPYTGNAKYLDLWYIAANGSATYMRPVPVVNGFVSFDVKHFSQYDLIPVASSGSSVIKTGAGSSAASTTQTVTTDLTPGSITKVTVDGKVVDAKYYTVSGSNVTFTAEFLKTLKNGSHTVTVENATKIAKGVFTVNNPTTAQSPTTADAGIALYAGMAIASVMGTGVVFTSRKRKNH